MKNFIRFLIVVLLMVSYTSCDEIDKLTEVDINTTLNEQLDATVPAGKDLAVSNTMSIDMVNSDTERYLDVLQSVRITSFRYELTNFTGDSNGTITGNFVADGIELLSHDMVVKQIVDAGTVFEVTNAAQLSAMASKLKAGKDILIGLVGTSNCNETMNFTANITIELEITADVL
ncbi:MAG: hypothetical protein P8K68_01575 [Algibacter sp.]|uniref:hypothetical protein n=1 Tax=Algibacter sp. TaxID=1872428 RepID=UPI002604E0DE|nr:hypothetical protein [Algibacter sp.]MDG1730640.1 hypothetical protein [Algibacter sp.]MDG2177461.1 hypothetical protein [Algibacter sp.]